MDSLSTPQSVEHYADVFVYGVRSWKKAYDGLFSHAEFFDFLKQVFVIIVKDKTLLEGLNSIFFIACCEICPSQV